MQRDIGKSLGDCYMDAYAAVGSGFFLAQYAAHELGSSVKDGFKNCQDAAQKTLETLEHVILKDERRAEKEFETFLEEAWNLQEAMKGVSIFRKLAIFFGLRPRITSGISGVKIQ